jgi:hypothetical protein
MNFYQNTACTNCGHKFASHEKVEFEYLLNNTHSILLCKKCFAPLNEFFKMIEHLGNKCNNIYDAMNDYMDKCVMCKKSGSKNYYLKKTKSHLLLCNSCNKLIEIYLNEVIKQNGKLRNFGIYTNILNKLCADIIKGATNTK